MHRAIRVSLLPRLAVLIATFLVARNVHAAGNHHSAALSGRSALMGGTGVALGADGAAPFLNPATVARIGNRRLAFSTTFFRYSKHRLDHFYQPGGVDTDQFGNVDLRDSAIEHRHFNTLPDTTCVFLLTGTGIRSGERRARAGRQQLSGCLAKTERSEEQLKARLFGTDSAGTRLDQIAHFDVGSYRLSIGPTWGMYLTDDVAVGASLFVTRTKYEHVILASTVAEDAVGSASASTYESLVHAYSWDLVPSVGATYQVSKVLSAGASLRVPLVHVIGRARMGQVNSFDATESTRRQSAAEGTYVARPPIQLGLGFGAEWRMVRAEIDGFFTAGQSNYARGNLDRDEIFFQSGQVTSRTASRLLIVESSNAVVNVGLGAEVFVAPRLGLLFGVQTDVNALPELMPNDEARVFRTRLDYYRAGGGISSYTDFGDLVLGAQFAYGSGEASTVNALVVPPALGRSDLHEFGALIVIAGGVNWGSLKESAGHVGDIVEGDAEPPPKKPPEPMLVPKNP